jgi:hypothetical protein
MIVALPQFLEVAHPLRDSSASRSLLRCPVMSEMVRSSTPPGILQPPPRRPHVNGFAVAALVVGVAGGPVIGIWLASVALRQISERGDRGRWMALTGLLASIIWSLAIIVPIMVSTVI